jgi:hypothetical protein
MEKYKKPSRENTKKRKFDALIYQESKLDSELTFKEIKEKFFKKNQ